MRTFYYNIEIVRANADKLVKTHGYKHLKSEGILKVECDEQGIKNIEGVLDLDIIVSEIQEDKIILKYYIPTENFERLRLDTEIIFEAEEIEIPINFEYSNNLRYIEIRTISKISTPNVEERYNNKLQEVKSVMLHN